MAILDDVALMTKMAAKKTAGVVGDDLALNANQVTNIIAHRELPVIFAIFKGAFINKLILAPLALTISYFVPWLITPLLMVGGAYLCFEGAEKVLHHFLHKKEEDNNRKAVIDAISDPNVDILTFEKEKIKGAIKTDFILSAEIIAIALGVVANKPILVQAVVLLLIGICMTILIYGFVAVLVRIDDVGFYLKKKANVSYQKLGDLLIQSTPKIMKILSVLGTIAMFLVGGEIITHGIHSIEQVLHQIPIPLISNIVFGFLVGLTLVGLLNLFEILKKD